jgi:hypothetical protein
LPARRKHPLLVLVKTDEPYIPWELAVVPHDANLQPPEDTSAHLPFWAAQTWFGRWIDRPSIRPMPPVAQQLTRITAVAAPYDPLESGQRALPYAMQECAFLVDSWQAVALLAKRKDLETVLVGAITPGHLMHIAAHGQSIPLSNDQALLLADKQKLSPRKLMTSPDPGQSPRFTVIFLNACQVGVPGMSLGQTGGFPGEVLKGGGMGFLAPLWNVNDAEAYAFASRFYGAIFEQHEPVGAILRDYRLTHQSLGHTTRLAYVWYGHPALRISYSP